MNEIQDRSLNLWPRVWGLMIATLFVLSVFHSSELVTASYDLPHAAWSMPIVAAAEWWHGSMAQLGIAETAQSIRDWFTELQMEPVGSFGE